MKTWLKIMKLQELTSEELKEYKHYLNSKRLKNIVNNDEFYDKKFLYHLARLAGECEMILLEQDLDLQRNKEYLKAIRRGEVNDKEVKSWFSEKEKTLEKYYRESKLPEKPQLSKVRNLLLNCLESHYGKLENFVEPNKERSVLLEIKNLISEVV